MVLRSSSEELYLFEANAEDVRVQFLLSI